MTETTAAASAANVHTPERQPGESQAQYRERQKHSRAAAKALRPNRGGKTTGREDLRDAQRRNGSLVGSFGRGLIRAAARKRAEAMNGGQRDDSGAYTLIGRPADQVEALLSSLPNGRRIWLAGISARRGY